MKIVMVSPVSYYPAVSGNSTRVMQLLNAIKVIRNDLEIHFILCPVDKIDSRFDGCFPDNKINNIVLNEGKKYSSAINYKLFNFIRRVLKKYLKIQSILTDDFMFKDSLINRRARKDFKRVVEKINPDVVFVEYLVMSKLALCLKGDPVLVVDTHDKLGNRNNVLRRYGNSGFWLSLSERQEKSLLNRFDFALAIQKNEGDYFSELADKNTTKVRTLSIVEPPKKISLELPASNVIGFIGSNNKHNQDGLNYFFKNRWPEVKEKVENVKLHIAGSIALDADFYRDKNVEHLGKVDSLEKFYQSCSFIINPCLSGTGLKIKTTEALTYGKVVVATPVGSEGIEDAEGEGLFVKSLTNDDFSNCCIKLFQDRKILDGFSLRSREYIEKKYRYSIRVLTDIIESGD